MSDTDTGLDREFAQEQDEQAPGEHEPPADGQ